MTASRLFRAFVLLIGLLAFGSTASAQVNVSSDLVSRYVWRGFDFGESFSVQPTLSYSTGSFAIGTWASYSISADGASANEHDLYLSYSVGPVTLGLTDFYFPSPPSASGIPEGSQFFNFDDGGEGAHYLEPSIRVTGPTSFPVSLSGSIVAYNAPNHPFYLEASIPFTVQGVDMGLSTGGVIVKPDDEGTLNVKETDAFYGLSGPAYTKVSLSATKALQITETFDLPVSATFIVNPHTERTFLVFGVNVRP